MIRFSLGSSFTTTNEIEKMNTNQTRSDYYTQRLLAYFQGKPEGRYLPYDVRMDLGISGTSWRWFATRHLYPDGSAVRAKLSAIGVEIKTWERPVHKSGETILTSSFVVASPEALSRAEALNG